ncbi:MAG: S-methyl-5-thioribose-1-phosphate isomerase [Candidatus Omnitrophota bacterium]
MKYETIRWKNNTVQIIDQRLLPGKLWYVPCRTAREMFTAIREMKIRGAPAIGVAGAYGVYLGIRGSRARDYRGFKKDLDKTIKYLASTRPTARNLFWALERMAKVATSNKDRSVRDLKQTILKEAHKILKEDKEVCHAIGRHGKKLIKKGSSVLTHCNAGGLATAGPGTALSVIFAARKKIKRAFADETRPVLQGARLTVWELLNEKVPTTLICDNMAAALMSKKEIDAIVVGADRIAANGDTANKIGTYNLAVLARYHNVPFYVAAPVSTFDLTLNNGSRIPIEQRDPSEVRKFGGKYITVKNVNVKNPAFDVTPSKLITAIITERGVIKRPDRKKIRKTCGK